MPTTPKSIASIEFSDQLINEITTGVQKTLSSVFKVNPIPGPHFIAQDYTGSGDVSGFVTLTQERLEGALVVSFPAKSIYALLSRLYKREFTTIDKSTRQGVGEVTNMVFGSLKANLRSSGYTLQMVIPTVLTSDFGVSETGTPPPVAIYMPGKTLVMPFETEVGSFTVMLLLYPADMVNFDAA